MRFIDIKYSTRLVILIGSYAIKIPLSRRGYLQSKNEKKLWNEYSHTGMLGKIHFEFIGIVCMKRYPPIKRLLRSYVAGIKMVIPDLDIKNCDLNNKNNWGSDDGVFLLVDYGINEYISSLY